MIVLGPTMKLFLRTAVLCIIPKFVNAAEAQIKKLATPAVPTNKELEQQAIEDIQNKEAWEQKHNPKKHEQYIIPEFSTAIAQSNIFMPERVNTHKNPVDVIDPRGDRGQVVYGSKCTVQESKLGSRFNESVTNKKQTKNTPLYRSSGWTNNPNPITKEVHDTCNEFWREMSKRNKIAGKTNRRYPFTKNDAARATNVFWNEDWGVSTLTKCLRDPGCSTRLERDDCPSYEEVYGTPPKVIRSVSQFIDMNKLGTIEKEET